MIFKRKNKVKLTPLVAEDCGVKYIRALPPRFALFPRFFWLAALALLSGCGASGHGYPDKASRLVSGTASWLYWLDNDHVFIPGYAPDDKLLDEDGKPKKGLYILDARDNSYVRYSDLGDYSQFCFHEGFITYAVSGKAKGSLDEVLATIRQKEGKFGEEKLLPAGAKFNADIDSSNSYTDCPQVDRAKRLRPEHAEPMRRDLLVHAIYLREQDGYILADMCTRPYPECTLPVKETFDSPVNLYRPDRAKPIEVPILAKEFALGSYIRYAEWANKYVIVPGERRDVPYGRLTNGMYGKAPYQVYLIVEAHLKLPSPAR